MDVEPAKSDRQQRDRQSASRRSEPRSRMVVRRKLRVGSADDPAEAEADRIVQDVLRQLDQGSLDGLGVVPAAEEGGRARRMAAPMPRGGGGVDAETEAAIGRARRSGSALPSTANAEMSSGFGADFSGVRVHTGPEADTLSRSLGAKAFTVDSDVFFAAGAFQPDTRAGKQLLAHELAHTVQSGSVSRVVRRAGEGAE